MNNYWCLKFKLYDCILKPLNTPSVWQRTRHFSGCTVFFKPSFCPHCPRVVNVAFFTISQLTTTLWSASWVCYLLFLLCPVPLTYHYRTAIQKAILFSHGSAAVYPELFITTRIISELCLHSFSQSHTNHTIPLIFIILPMYLTYVPLADETPLLPASATSLPTVS